MKIMIYLSIATLILSLCVVVAHATSLHASLFDQHAEEIYFTLSDIDITKGTSQSLLLSVSSATVLNLHSVPSNFTVYILAHLSNNTIVQQSTIMSGVQPLSTLQSYQFTLSNFSWSELPMFEQSDPHSPPFSLLHNQEDYPQGSPVSSSISNQLQLQADSDNPAAVAITAVDLFFVLSFSKLPPPATGIGGNVQVGWELYAGHSSIPYQKSSQAVPVNQPFFDGISVTLKPLSQSAQENVREFDIVLTGSQVDLFSQFYITVEHFGQLQFSSVLHEQSPTCMSETGLAVPVQLKQSLRTPYNNDNMLFVTLPKQYKHNSIIKIVCKNVVVQQVTPAVTQFNVFDHDNILFIVQRDSDEGLLTIRTPTNTFIWNKKHYDHSQFMAKVYVVVSISLPIIVISAGLLAVICCLRSQNRHAEDQPLLPFATINNQS